MTTRNGDSFVKSDFHPRDGNGENGKGMHDALNDARIRWTNWPDTVLFREA